MEQTYGQKLAEEIRASGKAYEALSEYEKFIYNEGDRYSSSEKLMNGFNRLEKVRAGKVLSEQEFIAEFLTGIPEPNESEEERASIIYHLLLPLLRDGRIQPSQVYAFARYRYCEKHPSAIMIKHSGGTWILNTCDTAVTEDAAKIKICENFGFEASRIRIIGTPYYESTDWQFICFEVAGRGYLYTDDSLYPDLQ